MIKVWKLMPTIVAIVAMMLTGLLVGCGGSGHGPSKESGELEPYQANVLVEPAEANIGDRVTITIETMHPPGSEVLNARLTINTNLFMFDGVNPRETLPVKGNRLTRQSFVTTYFELGEVQAASGHVVCIHTNSPDKFIEVPSQAVHFVSILNPAEQALDLPTGVVVAATSEVFTARRSYFRDTAETPWDRSTSVIPLWAWPLIMLGLTLLLVWLLWIAFRSNKQKGAPRRRTFTAVQLARRELLALKQSRHAEEGRVEPFYVELSGIARRYLERQFHLNAPEQTTEEFLHDLAKDDRLDGEQKDLLGRFLNESDLVKFARATPTMDNMNDAFHAAERLVQETETKSAGYGERFTPDSLEPAAAVAGPGPSAPAQVAHRSKAAQATRPEMAPDATEKRSAFAKKSTATPAKKTTASANKSPKKKSKGGDAS